MQGTIFHELVDQNLLHFLTVAYQCYQVLMTQLGKNLDLETIKLNPNLVKVQMKVFSEYRSCVYITCPVDFRHSKSTPVTTIIKPFALTLQKIEAKEMK